MCGGRKEAEKDLAVVEEDYCGGDCGGGIEV